MKFIYKSGILSLVTFGFFFIFFTIIIFGTFSLTEDSAFQDAQESMINLTEKYKGWIYLSILIVSASIAFLVGYSHFTKNKKDNAGVNLE